MIDLEVEVQLHYFPSGFSRKARKLEYGIVGRGLDDRESIGVRGVDVEIEMYI